MPKGQLHLTQICRCGGQPAAERFQGYKCAGKGSLEGSNVRHLLSYKKTSSDV